MAQSVKLKDGSYIDTEGIYDVTQGKTQAEINSAQATVNDGIQHIKYSTITSTTNSEGMINFSQPTGSSVIHVVSAYTGNICIYRATGQVMVYKYSDLSPVKNTSVKFTYFYIQN